ncbi:hypothetical protein ASD54_21755 [Rhizobium sp. Root149]|uniref:antibiotic biosynthesis monooxygenase family protein n=1 Tax=Rhizobium sp. Root149 TaxID=1736473 RepID=UPI0007159D98|nr:antibiotic biosynthesis monooxygenase [Rhizobium sp. Root149]KQZ46643.1 hypothetical protein ASD54_21755 [Rhizobium sp. Root149]
MIVEVATINVKRGSEEAFEEAVGKARDVFSQAHGCVGLALEKCVEKPGEYAVIIRWRKLEDHVPGFRESPLFAEWRALISPHFTEPPTVKHFVVKLELMSF